MSFMNKILKTFGLSAAAVGVALAFAPVTAQAATIYASSAETIVDGPRGTANGRDDITNAFGSSDGTFYEIGFGGVVEFQFGSPTGQTFFGPGSLIEVTFGNADDFLEAALIEVGLKGDDSSFVTALPNPFLNNAGSAAFTFSGVFNTVRITDLTLSLFAGTPSTRINTGGFDVESIAVNAVPLPAAGFLLLGAFGGLAAMGRRRKAA